MRLVCVYGVDEENREDRKNGIDGTNGIDGEDKADRTIKTIKTIKKKINLLLEGVRLGLSQKKTPRDSTQTYSLR